MARKIEVPTAPNICQGSPRFLLFEIPTTNLLNSSSALCQHKTNFCIAYRALLNFKHLHNNRSTWYTLPISFFITYQLLTCIHHWTTFSEIYWNRRVKRTRGFYANQNTLKYISAAPNMKYTTMLRKLGMYKVVQI